MIVAIKPDILKAKGSFTGKEIGPRKKTFKPAVLRNGAQLRLVMTRAVIKPKTPTSSLAASSFVLVSGSTSAPGAGTCTIKKIKSRIVYSTPGSHYPCCLYTVPSKIFSDINVGFDLKKWHNFNCFYFHPISNTNINKTLLLVEKKNPHFLVYKVPLLMFMILCFVYINSIYKFIRIDVVINRVTLYSHLTCKVL